MNKNEIKEIQQQTLKLIQIQESSDSEEDHNITPSSSAQ